MKTISSAYISAPTKCDLVQQPTAASDNNTNRSSMYTQNKIELDILTLNRIVPNRRSARSFGRTSVVIGMLRRKTPFDCCRTVLV
jgi:hypothetical protein